MSGAPEVIRDRAAQRALLERFARERPAALLLDAAAPALLDVFSGKVLPSTGAASREWRRPGTATPALPYLALLRDDGRQVILADVGIAFEPLAAATGPLPGLPAGGLLPRLRRHRRADRAPARRPPGEPVTRDHLDLFLFLVALVDGARAVGFDVSAEERRLERILGEIEARRSDDDAAS